MIQTCMGGLAPSVGRTNIAVPPAAATQRPRPTERALSAWLFPGPVALYRMPVAEAFPHTILAAERSLIAGAVPARQSEFAAGRACARRALEALGLSATAIPAGPDRMPLWPEGIVGSISHDADSAFAVAGCTQDWIGIGLDVELCGDVPSEIASLICSDEERAASAHWGAGLDFIALTFSAKESVFKCFYPLTRKFLDFLDVVIRWQPHSDDRTSGRFDALFSPAVEQERRPIVIEGRWQIANGRIHTSAFVRAVWEPSTLWPETSAKLSVASDARPRAEVGEGDTA